MSDAGLRMNFAALTRADPYAREIIDCATHVALYTFEENEWEKTNIEGALFVYSRNGEPYHSLVIMNRLSTNNLIEPVSKGIELQLQVPFLLYRNSKCHIFGIWFYDKDECVRVANKLTSLLKGPGKPSSSENMSQNPYNSSTPSAAAPVDIFSMLSKAQDDFNSNKGQAAGKSDSTPSKGPDMTSQSVMDFFAKAGSGATAHLPAVSSLPSPGIFGPRPTDAREGPMLLQRLMSNPVHSVEHIEKQQRSVTPQESQGSNGILTMDSALQQCSSYQMKSTPIEKQNHQRLSKVQNLDTIGTNGPNPLDLDINLMRISSPKPSSPLALYLNQSQDVSHSVSSINGSKLEDGGMYPLLNNVNTQHKPALMPPTMFTASAASDTQHSPEPLTRNQLLQAFNYLLKHDTEFVNKLHEAYVKSFSEKAFSVS